MRDTVYLVMNGKGVRGLYKTRPKLKSGEYAVRLKVYVPALFFDRAIPEVNLEIPEGYMIEPPVEVELQRPEIPEDYELETDMEGDVRPEPPRENGQEQPQHAAQ